MKPGDTSITAGRVGKVEIKGDNILLGVPFVFTKDDGPRIDLVLQWTEATDEHLRSYANGIPTGSGGTHESGLRDGLDEFMKSGPAVWEVIGVLELETAEGGPQVVSVGSGVKVQSIPGPGEGS